MKQLGRDTVAPLPVARAAQPYPGQAVAGADAMSSHPYLFFRFVAFDFGLAVDTDFANHCA